jgi:hypothetical protein
MRMPSTLLKEFIVSLGGKAGSTVEAYQGLQKPET